MQCADITVDVNDKDYVSVIGFSPVQDITVDEIIQKFGNPDGVAIARLGIEMQPPVAMMLYYDKVNMIVHLPEQMSLLRFATRYSNRKNCIFGTS